MEKTKVYTFNPSFLPKELEDFEKNQEKYLQRVKTLEPKLKTGDIVQLKPYLVGRNAGKFIYDGENVVGLSYKYDDYGHLPLIPEFEVVRNFPIKYWSEALPDTNSVYFNPKALNPNINQIYQYGKTFYYLFKGLDDKLYGIFEVYDTTMPVENKQEFLERMLDTPHFMYVESNKDIRGEYMGEGQLDFDHILLFII